VTAKFAVFDANGVSIGTPGVVASFKLVQIITGTDVANVTDAVASRARDAAFRWDPTSQQWIFDIGTESLSAGKTYVYSIVLDDNTSIRFQFSLR
jgi:hypothetical protein